MGVDGGCQVSRSPPPKADGPEARWVNLQVRSDPAGMRRILEAGTLTMPRPGRRPK
jgi:hypothetical protein